MQPWENFSQCEFAWTSFDKPAKIFRQTSRIKGKWHPTQKPIELFSYLLRTFAKSGDRILDTHLGSGTSRMAAHKMGFEFVGCEINGDYFQRQEEDFKKECLSEMELF